MFDKDIESRYREKFILYKVLAMYKKKNILIKYITPYIYIKIKLFKQKKYIIVSIIYWILINIRLTNRFCDKIIKIINYLQNRLSTRSKTLVKWFQKSLNRKIARF